jgi:hypothetical protein
LDRAAAGSRAWLVGVFLLVAVECLLVVAAALDHYGEARDTTSLSFHFGVSSVELYRWEWEHGAYAYACHDGMGQWRQDQCTVFLFGTVLTVLCNAIAAAAGLVAIVMVIARGQAYSRPSPTYLLDPIRKLTTLTFVASAAALIAWSVCSHPVLVHTLRSVRWMTTEASDKKRSRRVGEACMLIFI